MTPKLNQNTLEQMASDIAALVHRRLPDSKIDVSLHTESTKLNSRTIVQVSASIPTQSGLFTVNLELDDLTPDHQ